jgi:hypothetical protein
MKAKYFLLNVLLSYTFSYSMEKELSTDREILSSFLATSMDTTHHIPIAPNLDDGDLYQLLNLYNTTIVKTANNLIENISCTLNTIDASIADLLATLIIKSPRLKSLNLDSSTFKDNSITVLLNALKKNSKQNLFSTIRLSNVMLEEKDLYAIHDLRQVYPKLKIYADNAYIERTFLHKALQQNSLFIPIK